MQKIQWHFLQTRFFSFFFYKLYLTFHLEFPFFESQQNFINLFHQQRYRVFQPCAYWNDISERTQLSDKCYKIKHRLSYHAQKLNVYVILICWKEFSDIVDNSLCYEIGKHVSPQVCNRQNLNYRSCTNLSFGHSYDHICDEFSNSFWFDTLFLILCMGTLFLHHFIFHQKFISLFHQHWYRVFQPCAYWNDISERTQLSDKCYKIKHRLSYHAQKLNVYVILICWKEFSDIVDNSLCYEIGKHVSPKVRNRQNLYYMSCTNGSFEHSYEHFCDEFSNSFWFDTLCHILYMGILCFYHWNICGLEDWYRVHISCTSF